MKRSRRILCWLGIPLLLWTGCCGIHCVQGPVWGRVETADGISRDDLTLYLYCRSHALHGSYTADQEHRVVASGRRFVFPWMFGGIDPTGCMLNVVHPLYQPHYESFEPGLHQGLPPIRLEPWDAVLAGAEAGEDVSPVTLADLNRHVFEVRHGFLEAHEGHPERVARYLPQLRAIYDRGLHSLPPMERERFGSTKDSLAQLAVVEQESGYRRPPEELALFAAAEAGDVSAVLQALDAGADPDAWDPRGRAALHLAAAQGHRDVVAALLERGARIDRRHEGLGSTPLLDAILHHQVETALLLIERGADVSLDAGGYVPLAAAARSGLDARVFRALLDAGALERARQPRHAADALHAASREGRSDLVPLLLERGLPPDVSQGAPHFTALMVAALDGQPDTARLLIEAGADVNARTDDGRTPLSMALQRDPPPRRSAEVVALLEAAGARE